MVSLRSAFVAQAFCLLELAAAWALGMLPSGSGMEGWKRCVPQFPFCPPG